MTYRTYIIVEGLKWALKTQQLSYVQTILNALTDEKEYEVWWQHEIIKAHRATTGNGLAFKDTIIGLPSLDTVIQFR